MKHYRSYLLRIWLDGDSDNLQFRASLEEPSTQRRIGFHNQTDLMNFLIQTEHKSAERPAQQPQPNSLSTQEGDTHD